MMDMLDLICVFASFTCLVGRAGRVIAPAQTNGDPKTMSIGVAAIPNHQCQYFPGRHQFLPPARQIYHVK